MKPLRAAIVYDCFGVGSLFKKRGFEVISWDTKTRNSDFDILVFTGGSDIDSMLYNEKPVHCGGFNKARESNEQLAWSMSYGKFKVGICRGGQFLNVKAGGKLWQDVDNHSGTHPVVDVRNGKIYPVSSAHHLMMIPPPQHEVIATAKRATTFKSEKKILKRGASGAPEEDIEAIWIRNFKSLCFQWHPEFGPDECEDYSFNLINEYYNAVHPKKA